MSASRPHLFNTVTLTNAAESGANTETVIATLAGVSCEFAQQIVQLIGAINITPGASTTAVTIRVRRETLTGALVGIADVHAADIAPSKLGVLTLAKVDTGREIAGATYVVTVQGTASATPIAFNDVCLSAIVG